MATTSQGTFDVKLEAVNAYWGQEHCRSITTVADVAGSLNDTYFDLNLITTEFVEAPYYVWFNVNAAGTDPAITGKTGIEVALATSDTANDVAIAMEAAISGASLPATTQITDNVVIVENTVLGKITPETDSGSTGFTFEVLIDAKGGFLGKTNDGGSTVNIEVNGVELTSDQTGAIILGESYAGASVSVDLGLLEITKERLGDIIGGVIGSNVTPMGGTQITGLGEGKLFKLLNELGGRLVLHPIRLPLSDKSLDFSIHNSAPKPASINYSGQDKQVLEVSFNAYLDGSVNKEINLAMWGDWTQDLA